MNNNREMIYKGYYNPETIAKFKAALDEAKKIVTNPNFSGKVKISSGNTKMGAVPSVSMLPFITCPARCAETCGPDCYAAKLANLRENVRNAWAYNTALAMFRPEIYWSGIREILAVSRYFRYHVSGDFLSMAYFQEVVKSAIDFPKCEILAFTARFEIVNKWIKENGPLPENLHLHFSGAHGRDTKNVNDLPETRIIYKGESPDESWKVCGGNCFNCACRGVGCWTSGKGETICFKKH